MRPQLVQAAALLRENNPESIHKAIGLLQSTVFAFSMKLCGHPQDAEDTMQEVLMRSLPHLSKIENPAALAVWLYTVTRNRCWRMRRKPANAPAQTLSLDELMPGQADFDRLRSQLGNPLPDSPEDAAVNQQHHQMLHLAILAIPPQYRMVLVLHDMEDLDTDQIAKILDLKPGTVRVRLHRARLAVRKTMAGMLDAIPAPGFSAQPTKPAANPAPRFQERPPACRELFANLSDYLDGELEPKTCDQMRKHIDACPSCILFLRDLRQAIDRCRSLDVDCDPEVGAQLRSLLTREYLRLVGASAV